MNVRYTYRLRPGKTAQRYLAREWGMCRYVWNQLTAESKNRHITNPDGTFGYAAQDKFLT
ncbi:MAG: helix-turn-helix domain-containing protein, partial [Actinomycetales bacterium]|nr:helix-turn-helix domain-containing protein [Actinomycetales bacterium]